MLKRLSRAGTSGLTDGSNINRVIIINTLSVTLCLLILSIGTVFYLLSRKLSILIPACIELLLVASPLYLNYRKKYTAAALVTFFTQCAAALYFGMLLSPVVQLQTLIIFLLSIIYLLLGPEESGWRKICLGTAILILIVLQVNVHYPLIAPLQLGKTEAIIFETFSLTGLLILILVVSRSYMLSHDLYQALKRANYYKQIFIYQVTHELRTPLNAVYGIAQLMKKEIRLDPHLKNMEPLNDQLMAATAHARSVVNNVLDMAQIESGRIETNTVGAFLVAPFFSNIIEMNRVIAKARNIQLQLQIEQMPDVMISDKLKLQQIATNLLTNGIKYGYKKSIVCLRIICDANEPHKWIMQVINQGPGISPEKIPFIFDPFIRDQKDVHTEGTGLGLYIVRNKVESMNGAIEVSSEAGGRTVFTVTLPLAHGWLKDLQPEEDPEKEQHRLAGIRVLVADDDPLNASMLTRYLELHGCQVTAVTNGHEVMKEVQEPGAAFDIIILDYHMPGLDGVETVKRLKQHPSTRSTPVCMATGDVFRDTQVLLRKAGADAVIEKPIEYRKLLQLLNWHLFQKKNNEPEGMFQ